MTLRLSNATGGFTIGRADGTATIVDDDPTSGVSVSIGDATIVEGDSGMRVLRFPVTLTSPSATPIVIGWNTVSVTATCGPLVKRAPTVVGQDCGVLTTLVRHDTLLRPLFPTRKAPLRTGIPRPTGVSKHIDVAVFGDTAAEGDEQFTITISWPGVTLDRASAIGTIIDDD